MFKIELVIKIRKKKEVAFEMLYKMNCKQMCQHLWLWSEITFQHENEPIRREEKIKERMNKVTYVAKRKETKQLWQRERPQTCIYNLLGANSAHIMNNNKKRKERHIQEQNLGYEPHDILIHELNSHKYIYKSRHSAHSFFFFFI